MRFCPNNFYGQPSGSPLCAFLVIVFSAPAGRILRHPDVVRPISAAKHIAEIHSGPLLLGSHVMRLAGDKILLREIVEAGGVEPPSEKPCNQKTTCLSRSQAALPRGNPLFAGRGQNGQETKPASPMISLAQHGPRSARQPTM